MLWPPGWLQFLILHSGRQSEFSPWFQCITVSPNHMSLKTYCLPDLCSSATMLIVFRSGLLATGTFHVLEAGPKNFTVDTGGNSERILVDRLKPAPVVPAPRSDIDLI